MVTQEQLEHMRSQRSKLQTHLDYTPDNALYAKIGFDQDRKREREIKLAERAMLDAKRDMRREYELARFRGQAKSDFLKRTQPKKEITL